MLLQLSFTYSIRPSLLKMSFPPQLTRRIHSSSGISSHKTISNTCETTRSRTDQTLLLPDNRTLGYATYGPPTGRPLVYFHGFPASRLEAQVVENLAYKHKLRLIAPDRPGFGLSSPQPGRRITDWPADVRALATHLGMSRFAVLGGSGGGPYALACAKGLPREMMSAVGVMAGAPPWEPGPGEVLPTRVGRRYMSLSRRMLAMAADYVPTGLRVVANALVSAIRWIVTTKPVRRRIDAWLEKSVKEEKDKRLQRGDEDSEEEQLTTEQRRQRLFRMLFEAFAQGADATVQEIQLLTHHWGLKFEEIEYGPIHFWHGYKDTNAPVSMIRYMADRLPHARLKEYPDDNHYATVNHVEEIIADIIHDNTASKTSSDKA